MAHEGKSDLLLNPLKNSVPFPPETGIVAGEIYEVLIENAYDPSKFWIILKFQELLIFMKYLKRFYSIITNRKAIPRHGLKKDLLCIVNRNNMYYRSIVLPALFLDENKIRVFIIDFGLIINVHMDEVFYIFKKHCGVPRFAMRASLANISPIDQSRTWSQSDLRAFCEMVQGKRVFAEVCQVDNKRSILFVEIRVVVDGMSNSISSTLVNTGRAVYNRYYNVRKTECKSKYKSKVKYPHLFPSFEALENGRVPCTLWEYNLLKSSVPLDLLYKHYYQYQSNGASDNQ